jgi:hypothetical protein
LTTELSYQVQNTLGQTLLSGTLEQEQAQLSLGQLPNGYYLLVLEGEADARAVYPVVKQ